MFKDLEIMKALRYLLMVTAVLSVLSVSAQTPQYGKTYSPRIEQVTYDRVQVNAQMPEATMGSVSSEFMSSGSTLPQAAVNGVTTTESSKPGIRRIGGGNSGGGSGPTNPDDPFATPIGDAAMPLALCALAYLILRVGRKRSRV